MGSSHIGYRLPGLHTCTLPTPTPGLERLITKECFRYSADTIADLSSSMLASLLSTPSRSSIPARRTQSLSAASFSPIRTFPRGFELVAPTAHRRRLGYMVVRILDTSTI